MLTLVASALAGGDCGDSNIDAADVLRTGEGLDNWRHRLRGQGTIHPGVMNFLRPWGLRNQVSRMRAFRGHELGAHLGDAPLLLPPRLEFVFFSTCLTVSREMESVNSSFTASSASNRKVQRVCPSGTALQATATRWASCFPSSLRRCPGRGRSLRARCNPPSTKRWRTRPTVAGPNGLLASSALHGRPGAGFGFGKPGFPQLAACPRNNVLNVIRL